MKCYTRYKEWHTFPWLAQKYRDNQNQESYHLQLVSISTISKEVWENFPTCSDSSQACQASEGSRLWLLLTLGMVDPVHGFQAFLSQLNQARFSLPAMSIMCTFKTFEQLVNPNSTYNNGFITDHTMTFRIHSYVPIPPSWMMVFYVDCAHKKTFHISCLTPTKVSWLAHALLINETQWRIGQTMYISSTQTILTVGMVVCNFSTTSLEPSIWISWHFRLLYTLTTSLTMSGILKPCGNCPLDKWTW